MAITINQQPEDVVFYNQLLYYRCSSTNTAQPNFRYIVKVTIDGETVETHHEPNMQNRLIYDLYPTARHYVGYDINDYNTTDSIHSIPNGVVNRSFSQAEASCKKALVEFEEGWDVAGVFTNQGATQSHTIYLTNGSQEVSLGDSFNRLQDNTTGIGHYPMTGNFGWLSDYRYDTWKPSEGSFGYGFASNVFIPVQESDWGVVTFYHDQATTIIASESVEIQYNLYEEDGTQIGSTETRTINSTYGGTSGTSTAQEDKVLHLGCYPKNISETAAFWTNHPDSANDWKYYTIRIHDAGGVFCSAPLIFVKQCETERKARIGWWGQSGGWEYFNFTAKDEKSITARSKTIHKPIGSWQGSSMRWDKHDRGETEFSRVTKKFLDVDSDWISAGQLEYMEGLIRSKEVFLINEDGSQTPLILETNSHTLKDGKEAEVYNASFKFRYAQPRR